MNHELMKLIKAFEDFEKGVQLLENFKLELKNLNTIGFEEEVQEIRTKLNDIDDIPFIRSKLKELKEKICRKEEIEKEKPEESKIEKEPKEETSLNKDAEMLEKYGFKVKRIVKFKK